MSRAGRFALIALRLGLGILFIGASVYKIQTPGAFAHQIFNYKILPTWAINPTALVLPWLQLFCGLALVIDRGALAAGFLIVIMMAVFQVAVASALYRGLNISCGCFKSGGAPATWLSFVRDTGILILAAIQTWFSFRKARSRANSAREVA